MRSIADLSLGGAPYLFSITIIIQVSNVSKSLTRSTKATKVGKLWLCRAWCAVLSLNKTYWQPTPGEDPNWHSTPFKLIIFNNILNIILLKTFAPMSTRFTPLHFLGSERSPIFGTWITCPSCNSTLSSISSHNSRIKMKWWRRLVSDIVLKASGGTLLGHGALSFVSLATVFINSSHVGTLSSSVMTLCKTNRLYWIGGVKFLVWYSVWMFWGNCYQWRGGPKILRRTFGLESAGSVGFYRKNRHHVRVGGAQGGPGHNTTPLYQY